MVSSELFQMLKFFMAVTFVIVLTLSGLLAEAQEIRGVSWAFILLLGGPVLILVWRDTGEMFRRLGRSSRPYRIIGRVFGYPQAAFGGVCVLVGLAVVPLVLYNWVAHGKPPHGPWLEAPGGFIAFGLVLMRNAFRATSQENGQLTSKRRAQ